MIVTSGDPFQIIQISCLLQNDMNDDLRLILDTKILNFRDSRFI